MSANNVVLCMKYEGSYHVFYSGCVDDDPKKPDYKNGYYKNFVDRNKALTYAHDTVNEIDKDCNKMGFSGIEYGVMEISIVKPLSNAKGVLSELIKSVGELKERTKTLIDLEIYDAGQTTEMKEEVRILGNVEDGQWAEMYNLREFLRELFQRMGDNEDLSKLGYDLLGKLDLDRQTENNSIMNVRFDANGNVIKKDSEGEKEDSASHIRPHPYLIEVKSADNQSENSKPFEVMPKELKELMNNGDVKRYLHNNFIDGFNKGILYGKAFGGEKENDLEVAVRVRRPSISGEKCTSNSKLPEEVMFPGIYGYIKAETDSEYKRGFTHGYTDGKKITHKELYEQFYEDILACRGMCYKEMVNYLVELEEKYDEE